jgi:hypothetical protein
MVKELFFKAEVKKAGERFLIEVPGNFIGLLGLKKGSIVDMTIRPAKLAILSPKFADIYRKNLPCLSKLSDREISVLLDIFSREKVTGKADLSGNARLSGLYAEFKEQLAKADKAGMKKQLSRAGRL